MLATPFGIVMLVRSSKMERKATDACHTVGDRDACKLFATVKSGSSDARHTVGNRDACKALATGERTQADACHRPPLGGGWRDLDIGVTTGADPADGASPITVGRKCQSRAVYDRVFVVLRVIVAGIRAWRIAR